MPRRHDAQNCRPRFQGGSIRRTHIWPDGAPNPCDWEHRPRRDDDVGKPYPEFAAVEAVTPTRPSWDEIKDDLRRRGVPTRQVTAVAMQEVALMERAGTQAPKARRFAKHEPRVKPVTAKSTGTPRSYLSWEDGLAALASQLEEAV